MALTVPVAEIVESSKNPLLGKHESWGRVLLGDIATIQNGFPFKSSQFTRDEGMPLIRIRDVGADSSDTYYQ
jgi:type I restriction enzyme S subunit